MTEASVKRYGIIVATASLVLAACSPSSDGSSGPPVIQEQPQTVSTDFDFTATGTFTAGDSPANATFTGGVATNGLWVIPDGETGVVTFTSPTRDLSFTVEGLDSESAAALFAKSARSGLAQKTTCGISDQGFDNTEPLGAEMFVRGGFNDWPALPAAPQNFVNFGDGTLQAEFELAAGEWEFKIASAGWDTQFAPDPDAEGTLQVGGPALLMQDTAPVGPNGVMNIPEDGCYNFVVDATDTAAPTVILTKVTLDDGSGGTPPGGGKTECGIDDQGFDNTEPFGAEMFVRGGFNDWPALPAAPQNFVNFGDGTLQAEFELTAGEWEFKIASAGWDTQFAPDPDAEGTLQVGGPALLMQDTAPVGPNGVMNIPEDGCYNFVVDATDPAAPTVKLTKVELGGGLPPGGGKEECGIDDQGFDNTEPFGAEMFVRGGFNDWPALPAAPQNFVNFGDGTLQAEFELAAGEWEFKIASAGWDTQFAPDPDAEGTLQVDGPALVMQDTAPVGPNGVMNIPTDGCYNFLVNAADVAAPTVQLTEVELGGGGVPPEAGATEIKAYDTAGSVVGEASIEDTAKTTFSVERPGTTATPVKRVEIFADNGDVGVDTMTWTVNPVDKPDLTDVVVNYHSPTGDYANTAVVVEGESFECVPNAGNAFGCSATVSAPIGGSLVFTVTNDGDVDPTGSFIGGPITDSGDQVVTAFSGNPEAITGDSDSVRGIPGENEVILYYLREDGDYSGWNLHLFPRDPATGDWTIFNGAEACVVEGVDDIGGYFRITLPPNPCYDADPDPLDTFPAVLGTVIHKGNSKSPDGDIIIEIARDGNVVFVTDSSPIVSSSPPSDSTVSIEGRSAHWVDRSTILWEPSGDVQSVEFLWSEDASIRGGAGAVVGNFESVELGSGTNPQPQNQLHLGDYPAYSIPSEIAADAESIVRAQLVVVGKDRFGLPVEATFVQIPGVLDDLYAAAATEIPLGVTWDGTTPTIRVWAPTADPEVGVTLNLYSAPGVPETQVAMIPDEASGVWSTTGDASWDRKYYDFTLQVYSYAPDAIVTNTVTDPYSVSLAANSQHSQIVNLDDQDLQPPGWDTLSLPEYGEPEDIVIYEQHMRDFSASDFSVPEEQRGKYTAFALDNTAGHAQLSSLADAGLTHMHLLPSFDIATIEERRENRVEIDDPVDDLCAANSAAAELCPTYSGLTIREMLEQKTEEDPTSTFQQEVIQWMRGLDGYNWGYDPWHYGVPEGSYASDPDGVARVYEYRQMVQGLAEKGLRLVIDVVYNHTNEGGQGSKSVLDRVVPGYYHRYNEDSGAIETATCCSNTATEFAMMGKLMDDTMLRFLTDYKVTGFRFDLMGFHTKAQMEALLAKLRAVDPTVYVYGEGWNFGEVQNDRRFVQATQDNLAGTGLGTFTDRIRDAVRGGGPFDSGIARTINQGFINGGGYDPNAENSLDDTGFIDEALCTSDQLRATLAGSISTYSFIDREGNETTGGDLGYSRCTDSSPTGYVSDPEEIINYSASHDNETIFDISQYKHPEATSAADRVRAELIGVDTILLAQGVPFLHSGQDLLRSKSVDRDSFDFGDWFNQQDFTKMGNNWAVGLPNAEKNEGEWPDITALFENPNTFVTPDDINLAAEHAKEMLRIRASSVLYRLRTAEQIQSRVEYFNTGPDQTLGLIVQGIDGCFEDGLTPEFGFVVNIFNANDEPQTIPLFTDENFTLHPVQQTSVDPVVQTATHDANGFFVPARTTAVFVREDQDSCTANPLGADIFVRGLNGDWTATADRELEYNGVNKFERVIALNGTTAADLSFKIADADWSVVNCGAGAESLVSLDEPYSLNCADGSGDLALNVAATGDYKFTVSGTDTSSLTLTVSSDPYEPDIFVRGFNADWNATPDNRLDLVASNTYQTTLNLPDPTADGALTFKIADADWASINCGSNGASAAVGADYALNCAGGSGDILLDATAAGDYSFTVDATDPANPVVLVEQAPLPAAIFVRGLNADWEATEPLPYVGGTTYRAVISLDGLTADDLSFKIADADWADVNCGADADPTVSLDADYALNCADGSGNLELDAAETGAYDFTVDAANASSPVLTVSGP